MSTEVISMREPEEPTTSERLVLSSGRYIFFGPFRIDQQRQEVTRNGSRLRLQGKVYHILLALIEKPGEVVTREELRLRLWPADTHVNYDANVNTTVNKLRLVLGDSSEKPLYIETIPRKGYCLLVQPEISETPRVVTPMVAAHGNALLKSQAGEWGAIAGQPSQDGNSSSMTNFWMVVGVIGLILAGMLLGAGLTRVWIAHIAPVSPWP